MNDAHKRDHHNKQGEGKGTSSQREGASSGGALASSREFASDAARRTATTIESNPLGIVVGGLALGAVAGALLPRTDKERQLLAPLGAKLGEKARGAISAAKDAGKSELEGHGISRDAARDQVKSLFDGVVQALSAAGAAAAKSTTGGTQTAAPANEQPADTAA